MKINEMSLFMKAEDIVLLKIYLEKNKDLNNWDEIEENTPSLKSLALIWKQTMQLSKKNGFKNSDKLIISSVLGVLKYVKFPDSDNVIIPIVKHSIFSTNFTDYNFIIDCLDTLNKQLEFDGEKILECFMRWAEEFNTDKDPISRYKCLVILNFLIEKIENTKVIDERIMNMELFDTLTESFPKIENDTQLTLTLLIIKVFGNISLKSFSLSEKTIGVLLSFVINDDYPLSVKKYALAYILDSLFLFPNLLNCSIELMEEHELEEESLLERLESLLNDDISETSLYIAYGLGRMVICKRCYDNTEEITAILVNRYLSLNSIEPNDNIEILTKFLHAFFVEMSKTIENQKAISNTIIYIIVTYFELRKSKEIELRYQDLEYDLLSETSSVNTVRNDSEEKKQLSKVKRAVRFLMNYVDDEMKDDIINLSIKNIENTLRVTVPRSKLKTLLGIS